MLAAVALGTYAIIHGSLSPSIAFTTLSVFQALDMTLAVIPGVISEYFDARVSIERVEKYLNSVENEQYTQAGSTVSFHNADIAWPTEHEEPDENQFSLQRLNISFPKNELSIVSGKTGSGKSLLLASILGEADLRSGIIQVPHGPRTDERLDHQANASNWHVEGSLAFVAQIPWIENATIKDNILFGLPFDSLRYRKTLSVCALQKDLEMFTDGELTDIGANGINLSGGQKWRVSFARALYSRASILILDDVFSAVDTNVGRQLFEEALTGELGRGRTRILVTHHVALCVSKAKYLVLLGNGGVLHAGMTDELQKNDGLKAILAQDVEEEQRQTKEEVQTQISPEIDDGEGLQYVTDQLRRRSSITEQNDAGLESMKAPKKFMKEETRERGAIQYKIYAEYIKASGGLPHWILILVVFAVSLIVILGRSWWISVWTRSHYTKAVSVSNLFRHQVYLQHLKEELSVMQIDKNLWFYLSVYLAWSVACTIGASRYFLIFLGSIRASKDLFQQLTYSVLRAPLSWLDTVPLGRILNRFTVDFNMIDSRISIDLAFMLHNIIQAVSVVIASMFVSLWMIVFTLILLASYMHYVLRYLHGARDVKRIESNCKSPIFDFFGETLIGISTIRAFDKMKIYEQRMYRKIDTYAQAYWHTWLFNRWMSLRLNILGAVFITITAILIITIRRIDASLAGFALSFVLEYTVMLVWALRQYTSVELDMNAMERIIEYSNNPIEDQSGEPAPAAWPTEGGLEVIDLVVGYAPHLPPVLKGLSFSVKRNQRVGVVGRTGAGKSTLTLALFRFLETREGVILIDGLDISKLRLQDVRSRLAIIPQDPVLFSGTVRSNLDAFDQHADEELRDALKRVHLIPDTIDDEHSLSANPSGTKNSNPSQHNKNTRLHLHSPISESGLNLSQGQRQLLCLARAIVQRPKILILDEATSAVDRETDALIQRSIREEFWDSTLIVIAHRLSTIADFDRILVLREGRKVEWGGPRELMERGIEDTVMGDGMVRDGKGEGEEEDKGVFRKMVEESGEKEVLERIIFGERYAQQHEEPNAGAER